MMYTESDTTGVKKKEKEKKKKKKCLCLHTMGSSSILIEAFMRFFLNLKQTFSFRSLIFPDIILYSNTRSLMFGVNNV